MSKEVTRDLLKFLKPFPEQVQETALWLREFVWDLYPKCTELIYDGYNALAIGWSTIKKLLKEAYANSLAKVKDKKQMVNGLTIIKLILPTKRRPL